MTSATGLLTVVPALILTLAPAWAQVVDEAFEGDASLADRGWRVEADDTQSLWDVREGVLEVTCLRSPYKGGRIVHEVPVIERGVLELDVQLAVTGSRDYDHLSLGLKLYGFLMAFKHYSGHHWMAHRPEDNTWYSATPAVPMSEWVHLRVEFDAPAGRIEYYMGDAPDPLLIDTRMVMKPDIPELELFNYGLTKGTVVHRVDNIVLRSLDGGAAGATERTRALVFGGMTSERYRAGEAVRAALPEDQVSVYTLGTRGSATSPTNQLALDRVPGAATWRGARYVVLEDVPAGPGECLPPHLLADLDRAVREGADLLVLGGAWAFGKGTYAGTPLAEMLPVQIGGPWELKRLDAPAPVYPDTDAALRWHHDLTPKPDTEAFVTAEGLVLHVRWAYGEGRVTAFLGAALGSESDFAANGATPFWEWDGWPDLVRTMLSIEEWR